jgi:EAL domain-containing protein (putative c-di-GMP-specific phosphodiesterase class I)
MIAGLGLEIPTTATPIDTHWCLEGLVHQGDVQRRIAVNSNPFHVGRSPQCNLVLPSRNVSKSHAQLISAGEILAVRDLGSTNGTYVNSKRITADALLNEGDFVQFGDTEFRTSRETVQNAERTVEKSNIGGAGVLSQFDRLLNQRCIVPFFQPVVELGAGTTIGFEVLARSTVKGMEGPLEMFSTAAKLNLEEKLSALCRTVGVLAGRELPSRPRIFVNTHPSECLMTGVLSSLRELRALVPDQPLTLELHEATVTDIPTMKALRAELNALDISLAYDDFGAGQSRLIDLVQVPPDYLKFDIHMIRDLHRAVPAKLKLVKTLVSMVRDFKIAALAEGIECREEGEVCKELGFEFAQGYFFGRPTPINAVCPLIRPESASVPNVNETFS